MPRVDILKQSTIVRTPRLIQLEGIFDLPAAKVSTFRLQADLPLEEKPWNIGLIVGPSGTGKTSLIEKLWNKRLVKQTWDENKSVVDNFPLTMSIKEVVGIMSAVGFSSPPAWLRAYQNLSTGERFRVSLARAIAESNLVVFDEYTSVVDRTVAKTASAAVAKMVRQKQNKQFVAVTCHDDVEDWLQPDWVYSTANNMFAWRLLQPRPKIQLEIRKAPRKLWQLFRLHHYLSETMSAMAKCFVGLIENKPAVFTAVVSTPHPRVPSWREHRTVCLPDYQGVGIGSAMSDFIAGIFACTGKPYRSITSHPAMIAHRNRSLNWQLVRQPSLGQLSVDRTRRNSPRRIEQPSTLSKAVREEKQPYDHGTSSRLTAAFVWIGPMLREHAAGFGLIRPDAAIQPIHDVHNQLASLWG
jgi:ABC-type molybdenum transport system ATPase subunit/photorepair protein PhrA